MAYHQYPGYTYHQYPGYGGGVAYGGGGTASMNRVITLPSPWTAATSAHEAVPFRASALPP